MSNAHRLIEQNAYCPSCEHVFFTSVNSPTLDVVFDPKTERYMYMIACPFCNHVGEEAISFATALDAFNNCNLE